jgi:hypothetical protein
LIGVGHAKNPAASCPKILGSLLLGNLTKEKRSDPELDACLVALRVHSVNQSGIYHQGIVKLKAESLSTNQLAMLSDRMVEYVRWSRKAEAQGLVGVVDNALAGMVDRSQTTEQRSIFLGSSKTRWRKYFRTKAQVEVDDTATPVNVYWVIDRRNAAPF